RDGPVLLLQTPTGSHQSPGRAQPGDEVSDPAAGLAPDLLGGREVMRPRIGRMVVLIRVPVALRVRRGELACLPDRPVRAVEPPGLSHSALRKTGGSGRPRAAEGGRGMSGVLPTNPHSAGSAALPSAALCRPLPPSTAAFTPLPSRSARRRGSPTPSRSRRSF